MMHTTNFKWNFLRFGLYLGLLLCSLLCANGALAQGWLRHYPSGNGTEPRQLVVAPNGDFIFGGVGYENNKAHFYLQRNDANGNKLWYKTIQIADQMPPNSSAEMYFIENCPGGGIIAGGNMLSGSLPIEVAVKLSDAGDSLWTFLPAPTVYGFMNTVTATPDGNLLFCGARKISPPNWPLLTPIMQKVNSADGSLMQFNALDESTLPQYSGSALYAPDGSIWHACFGNDSTYLRHIGVDGQVLQIIRYAGPSQEYPTLRHVPNGFSLTIHESHQNIWYRRFDYDGNLLASTDTPEMAFLSMVGTETSTGSAFTITLPTSPFEYETPRLYKMDFDGNIAPPIFPLDGFSLSTYDLAFNVQTASDGGFIFVGANLGAPTWFALKTDSLGHIDPAVLSGTVFRDADQDCLYTSGDTGLFPVQVRATDLNNGAEWYETTDSSGRYNLVVSTGDYEVEALAPVGASGFWGACPPQTVMAPVPGDTLNLDDIGLKPLVDCPFLQLQLGTWLFRPCSTSVLQVRVFNAGTAGVDSAVVQLDLDPLLHYDSSTVQPAGSNGNAFEFHTGPIAPLAETTFSVYVTVDCAAQLGQVLCVDGHVWPDSLCAPVDSLWDGAELKVDAFCGNDSVHFRVSNIGAGNMAQSANLVIIEDYIILRVVPLQLPAGQDTVISLPNPNAHTFYGRIEQTPGYPGLAFASDGKDFCDANGTPGMLLQYPLFSGGPFDTRFCDEVRASCDPNDKRGFPIGYGATHYIDRGIPIQYMIRFQNTGNDTAFNILVLDSLPETLDAATLQIGTAGHPFTWEWVGKNVLAFRFAQILLPDSATNEPASHGFIQFEIMPKSTLPKGTEIQNRAAIYFDYNAPVFTEYARHTVDSNFILLKNLEPLNHTAQVSVTPNPAEEATQLHLEIPGGKATFPLRLTVTDVLGRVLREEQISGPDVLLRRGGLPAGMCRLKWERLDGIVLAVGKVVWVD